MKKLLLSCFALFFVTAMAISQDNFSDDFEGYAVGDYPSATNSNWTTWSGTLGTAEDVQVTDVQAASGNHSIFFQGAGGGGPQDVLLLLGGFRNSGHLSFSAKFYLPEGSGAYFNFQGQENPGVTWTFNTYMRNTGNTDVDTEASYAFPFDQWFEYGIEANLDLGVYEVLIDGVCVGSFSRPNSAIASVDFFPLDGTQSFYIDDVAYSYSPNADGPQTYDTDVALTLNTGPTGFVGLPRSFEVALTNNGSNEITSVDLNYSLNGVANSQTFSGLSIAAGATENVFLENALEIIDGGNNVTVSVGSVNGAGADEYECNNNASVNIAGVVPAEDRKVWCEEATGTWCTWCPRGDVFMNLMAERYPDHFVGIAVHNGDPMADTDWDSGLTSFPGFSGFPSIVFEREIVQDPAAIEASIIQYVQEAPESFNIHEATFSEDTRELNLTVHTYFPAQAVGDFKLVVGLSEDGVTGTDSGYDQVNAYSGGGNGPMGGYEDLPNPVPASMMVYNHVGRALLTPWAGIDNAFSSTPIVEAGWYRHDFTYTVPAEYEVSNMHIVSSVLGAGGFVDNAESTTIEAAVDTKDVELESNINISPNPTSGIANIRIPLSEAANLSIVVTDAMGKVVSQRNYGRMSGDQIYPLITDNFASGLYYVRINADEAFAIKKLMVK